MSDQKAATTLQLRDISFSYQTSEQPVFSRINLQLTREKIGLVGDNGTGKTTLLHIMVGLLKPDQGDILLNDKVIKTDKDLFALRREVGLLFQNADDQLFCPSVLEDVAFGPLNLGKSQEEAREISHTTLKKIGLSGFEDRITHQLSGGEKRLVALATLLAMEPSILLLDEPTNDLDHEARHRLLDILSGLDQAFLLISHDWDFLAHLCTGYYSLEKGQLLQSTALKVHQHRHAHHLGEQGHHHDHTR